MNNKKIWLLLALFAAYLLAITIFNFNTAHAQQILSAALNVKSQDITVGDVIALELRVTHPSGWRVILPSLEQQWGEFEVRGQSVPEITTNPDGTQTTVQEIQVARMRPGEVSTPVFTLSVADDQGGLNSLEIASVPVTVRSVLVEGDTNLREIKPQVEMVSERHPYWPLIAAAIIGAAALIVHGINRWRLRKQIDRRTPRQKALDSLATLSSLQPQSSTEIKAQCALLSDLVRDYLASVTQLPARDLTTRELARRFREQEFAPVWSSSIVDILQVCDGVKFANEDLDAVQLQSMIANIRKFVEQYPPQPEPSKRRRGSKKVVEVMA
jgi:hypothetical protein